jgi:transcription antitermination factor NusG
VLNTCGVLRVLGTRESPAVVNEEEIRHLATVTRAKLDLQPCAFITSGQKVRIHRGPLCGVEGIITGFDSRRQKVVVSISLLQRSAAVSLEPEWLTPQSERLMQS